MLPSAWDTRVTSPSWFNRGILVDKGCEWSSSLDLNVLSVFDESNRPKQHGQGHCRAFFPFTFLTFTSAKSDPLVTSFQMFQAHVQFARLSHHPGLLGVRDRSDCLCSRFHDYHIADFQVLIKDQIDRVTFCCGFRTQVIGEFQLNVGAFL